MNINPSKDRKAIRLQFTVEGARFSFSPLPGGQWENKRDREESKNSAPTVAEFPEPADLLNQLKAQRKKSRVELADIEVILELLNQAGSSL